MFNSVKEAVVTVTLAVMVMGMTALFFRISTDPEPRLGQVHVADVTK